MISLLQKKLALSRSGAVGLIKGCITCLFFNISLMLPVVLLYRIICDAMEGNLDISLYVVGCIICVLCIGITQWFQYNATYLATYVESGVRRISVAERLRKLPLSFFGKKDLADLTSTIMADCTALEQTFSHYVPELIGAMISTFIVACFLFTKNIQMSIALFWPVPIAYLVVVLSWKVQDAVATKSVKAKVECAEGIQECLETARDLISNNAQEEYLKGLDKKIRNVEKRAILSEVITAIFVASSQYLLKIGIATVVLVGANRLVKGDINVVTFLLFLIIAGRIYDPLQESLTNMAAIIMARSHVTRMNEILNHPIQTGSDTLSNQGVDIVFNNVGFSYDEKEVLKDISFVAKQGEVTALVGPSGGGKTTVSRLAARFWDIQKGKITIGGMDVSTIDPETLLSLYSIVFQDVTLFNNTIMENIRIGRKDATDKEVLEAARLANVDQFASRLGYGYNSMIGENGCELSGGERQRISIARAFLKNAPILLLDEATASLDVENETLIQSALSRLIQNKTVLIIAHRMRTIQDADKIVVLSDGVVAEQGTAKQLDSKKGIFSNMLRLQTESQDWKIK